MGNLWESDPQKRWERDTRQWWGWLAIGLVTVVVMPFLFGPIYPALPLVAFGLLALLATFKPVSFMTTGSASSARLKVYCRSCDARQLKCDVTTLHAVATRSSDTAA
jgi:hypothetical protein